MLTSEDYVITWAAANFLMRSWAKRAGNFEKTSFSVKDISIWFVLLISITNLDYLMKQNINTLVLFLVFSTMVFVTSGVAQAQESSGDGDSPKIRAHQMSDEDRKEMRKKFRQHRKGKHRERIEELDTNQDDKVDLGEFLANAEKRFNELDANSDGYVTKEEARSKHRELRQKHKEMRKKMMEKHRNEQEEDTGT